MRADRLLAILMLLQARGRMTARDLAGELEVSERTIYRDVDALSAAGVPVYGEAGPEGGYQLIDDYRTSLTGLTDGELRALFMVGIPESLARLGVSQELRSALLKLSAALPASRRDDEARVRQRIHLDPAWWPQDDQPAPHLRSIYEAVWHDRRLRVAFRVGPLAIPLEQMVDPYGLVAKAGAWYLVYATSGSVRAQLVSALTSARATEQTFTRIADFDLATFWREWCADQDRRRSIYRVKARIAPRFVAELPRYFGGDIQERLARAGPADERGWIAIELVFESLDAARDRLLGFGSAVEVLEPHALRRSMLDYAEQIAGLYAG